MGLQSSETDDQAVFSAGAFASQLCRIAHLGAVIDACACSPDCTTVGLLCPVSAAAGASSEASRVADWTPPWWCSFV